MKWSKTALCNVGSVESLLKWKYSTKIPVPQNCTKVDIFSYFPPLELITNVLVSRLIFLAGPQTCQPSLPAVRPIFCVCLCSSTTSISRPGPPPPPPCYQWGWSGFSALSQSCCWCITAGMRGPAGAKQPVTIEQWAQCAQSLLALVTQAALHHYTEEWCTHAAAFTADHCVFNFNSTERGSE